METQFVNIKLNKSQERLLLLGSMLALFGMLYWSINLMADEQNKKEQVK